MKGKRDLSRMCRIWLLSHPMAQTTITSHLDFWTASVWSPRCHPQCPLPTPCTTKAVTWMVLLKLLSQIMCFLHSESFTASTFTMACEASRGFGPYCLSDLTHSCCPSDYAASASLSFLYRTSMALPQGLCSSARDPLPVNSLMVTPSSSWSDGNFLRGPPWPPCSIPPPRSLPCPTHSGPS